MRRHARALLPLIAIFLVWPEGCWSPCADEVVSDTASPDGKITATVMIRDCGAITKSATWVTLHPPSKPYSDKDALILTARQEQHISISWLDNSHVVVECLTCRKEDLQFQAEAKGSVRVSFRFDQLRP